MNITAKEKTMYEVMQAIYTSGIPISFKGSMVLKACLLEAGYSEEIRNTVDIDGNWISDTSPTMEQMATSLQAAIDKAGLELEVRVYRNYGQGRSAGFDFFTKASEKPLFSMDLDVNRPTPEMQMYDVESLRFRGVSPAQMTADKVAAVSTDKVFRRMKDVIDLYYMSKVFTFDADGIRKTLEHNGRALGDFYAFLYCPTELRHAYSRFAFRGCEYKPPFEEVYRTVKSYVKDILPEKEEALTKPKAPVQTL